MRLPTSSRPAAPKSPSAAKSLASPGLQSTSKSSEWEQKLKLRNRLSSHWTTDLPLFQEGNQSERSLTIHDLETESLYGSKAEIEYLPDEDDFARSIYQSPSTYVEGNAEDDDNRPPSPPTPPESSSPLTKSKRSKHQRKGEMSGYNFAAFLLDEEVL